ncbi:MAG: tetratricopeptide repeat protein, partial [Bryobacterales bacterium]|nr:tetratricopeptide repeat protein [Bryobacterales bacterium]
MIFRIAILGFLFFQSSFNSLEQGKQAFRVKNWPAAEHLFTQAIQSAPRAAAPYKWLGMTYAAQEKYLLAEEPFRRACSLDPKEPQACYYLARTLFLNNRFPEALQAYERLPSKNGPSLLGMALTLDALARFPEADVFFRKAIAAGDKQASLDYQQFLRRQAAPKPRPPELRFEPMDLPASVLNGAAGAMHLPETMFAGVAVFDYDNDGWPDIFLANGTAPCALLHNNHNGTFTNVTA